MTASERIRAARDAYVGPYVVETGVHGAVRINRREFDEVADALRFGKRWSASSTAPHYWAEVSRKREDGTLEPLATFNLSR